MAYTHQALGTILYPIKNEQYIFGSQRVASEIS